VVLASLARRDGIEYLLRGEILSDRVASKEPTDRVRLSWRLMSLDANDRHRTAKHEGGDVVFMDTALAIKKFPDLQLLEDRDAILATAIARESYALWAPSVVSIDSILTVPYFTPGSKETRRGISLAQAGRWGDAASVWEQVIRAHPSQSAAVQNLAIAAVAQQDFSRAKQLIRSAIEFRDRECYRESLAWIELRQREYHRAFGLPDPPEGWFVTNRSD
jgi:tetratricopeptide (TPR) repeat protein